MIKKLFILLFIVLGIDAHSSIPAAVNSSDKDVLSNLSIHTKGRIRSAAFVQSHQGSNNKNPGKHEPHTQLRPGTDLVIHVSLVPPLNSGFLFISDIRGLTPWRIHERLSPIINQSFFCVLFRVIISPNAP